MPQFIFHIFYLQEISFLVKLFILNKNKIFKVTIKNLKKINLNFMVSTKISNKNIFKFFIIIKKYFFIIDIFYLENLIFHINRIIFC